MTTTADRRRPQDGPARLSPTSDKVVELRGVVQLHPVGTLYSGGIAPYRPEDAPDVADVAVRELDAFLAESGSIGQALEWAHRKILARFDGPTRATHESRELDVLAWVAGVDVAQWREFARLCGLDVADDGSPTVGTRTTRADRSVTWEVRRDGMDWNQGGVTTGHHAWLTARLTPATCVGNVGEKLCESSYIVHTYPAERGWLPQPYCAIHHRLVAPDAYEDDATARGGTRRWTSPTT